MNKRLFFVFVFSVLRMSLFSVPQLPTEFVYLKNAYPDVDIEAIFDFNKNDWEIKISYEQNGKTKQESFYWENGKILPESELSNSAQYISVFYDYPAGKELQNPATFSPEQIEFFRQAGLSSSRKNDPFEATFFLDCIYDSKSRNSLEQNLARVKFLGHPVTIHKRIQEPLARVEQKLLEESKTNETIDAFIKSINKTDGYNWREIRDAERKSMHSIAIAIDILPKQMNKYIYWRWTKDILGDKWMLTPIKSRWMPPYDVINIFESEGFIWGGKWEIWDNMHFEYRPDIILFSQNNHKE